MSLRCRTCGGIYDPVQADGMLYFHACPPLQQVKIRRGAAELLVNPDRVLPGDIVLDRVQVARPNRRDENRPGAREEHTGQIRAAGGGTEPAP